MNRQSLVCWCVAGGFFLAGLAIADDMPGMKRGGAGPTSQPAGPAIAAVDLHNAVCPVSGDKVGDSNLVEVYDGKVYHLCCPDCHKDFEQDPAKFAAAVAGNPAKYGVK
ncbi:MAG: YHS domain-containing protein [Tepidisphaeraceae bacterium]|jgi:YHS domain-containing protein